MSRWDESDAFPDDMGAYCYNCGCWLDSGIGGRRRGGIGARVCYDCARPEPTHAYKSDGNRREPSCLKCGRERLDAVHCVPDPKPVEDLSPVWDGLGKVAGRTEQEK
jgi:hypothetical protein